MVNMIRSITNAVTRLQLWLLCSQKKKKNTTAIVFRILSQQKETSFLCDYACELTKCDET